MAKALILEADAIIAANLKRYLQKRGHKTKWVADPQSAIEEIDRLKPDVVVMDIILGEHNGVEFLFELRSYPEWQTINVILYSSLPEHELNANQSELKQLGIAAFFYKPQTSLLVLAQAIDGSLTSIRK